MTGALLALAACGDAASTDEAPSSVDAGPSRDPADLEQQRTARKAVMVQVAAAGQSAVDSQIAASSLALAIAADCFTQLQAKPGTWPFVATSTSAVVTGCQRIDPAPAPGSVADTGTCDIAICQAEADLCVANRLLEVASTVGTVSFSFASTTAGTSTPTTTVVRVGPQDQESATALREEAFRYAAFATTYAGENLRKAAGKTAPGGRCTSAQLANGVLGGMSYGDVFATVLSESTLLAKEAAKAAVKSHVAVASADLGLADGKVAAEFSWTNGEISRARAAHLLIGGGLDKGMADFKSKAGTDPASAPATVANSQGLCPTPPPTGSAAAAKRLLRLSGMNPAAIASEDAFQKLFEGTGFDTAPMRARLAERLGRPSLQNMTASQFLDEQGLQEVDFAVARNSLADEAKAFARGGAAVLPPLPVASTRNADGTLTSHVTASPIFAATATAPSAPPRGYYANNVRFAFPVASQPLGTVDAGSSALAMVNDGLPSGGTGAAVPGVAYATTSLSALLDYSRAVAAELARESTASGLGAMPLRQLGTLLGAEGAKVKGRLETCYRQNPNASGVVSDEYRVRVYGGQPLTGGQSLGAYVLVMGADGVRCAVSGTNDGADCTLASFTPASAGATQLATRKGDAATAPTASAPNPDYAPQAGFPSFVETGLSLPFPAVGAAARQVYVVQLKPGVTVAAPGNYTLLGSFRALHDTTVGTANGTYRFCTLQAIDDEITELVDDTLTPGDGDCGQAAHTCEDTRLTDKIPLESELSEDGSAFESSWRVHLARARLAADRADQLGDELINSGLEIDRRVETSVEEIETLCGEAVSLADYFPGDMSGYVGGTCTDDQQGQACPAVGTICVNRQCVADPMTMIAARAAAGDANAKKILACLGGASSVDVSVGSRPMCVWVKKATNGACDPIEGALCPFPATLSGSTYSCPAPAGAPAAFATDYTMRMTTPLYYSALPDATPPPPPRPTPACSALRALRTPGAGGTKANLNALAGFLEIGHVTELARRIGWQAGPDDYSSVTVDGTPRFTTGSLFAAPPYYATGWPCSTSGYPGRENAGVACPADGGSPETNPSLMCAHTNACGPDDDASAAGQQLRVRRAMMNHRLGRAVLALRLITGAGMSGIRGPYLPSIDWRRDEAGNWGAGNDWSDWVDFDGQSSTQRLLAAASPRPAQNVQFGASMRFNDVEWTGVNSVSELPVPGLGLCFNDGPSAVWTDMHGPLVPRAGQLRWTTLYNAACDAYPSPRPPMAYAGLTDRYWPVFKDYADLTTSDAATPIAQMWQGLQTLGSQGELLPSQPGLNQLIYDLLAHPADPESIVIDGYTSIASLLTRYWSSSTYLDGLPANPIEIGTGVLRARDVLDGLELACEVERLDQTQELDCSRQAMPEVSSLADLGAVESRLQCAANVIESRAERLVFLDVPGVVLDATKDGVVQIHGTLGAAAAEFAKQLTAIYTLQLQVGETMGTLSSDIHRLKIALEKNKIASTLIDLKEASTMLDRAADCLAMGADLKNLFSHAATTVKCLNDFAQIGIALQEASLQQQDVKLDDTLTWVGFSDKFRASADALKKIASDLDGAQAGLRGALATILNARLGGLGELAKAMLLSTDAMGKHFAVNTVMRRRYNTLAIRYERARDAALKAAKIARLAVEQRLGFNLLSINKDPLLVEHPSHWANKLCMLPALDYGKIRDGWSTSPGGVPRPDNYADGYIGDYITKLETLVASYEFDYPFHEGRDTAVVSLRDDVTNTRKQCEVSVPNLLAYSTRLDVASDPRAPAGSSFQDNGPDHTPRTTSSTLPPIWRAAPCPPVNGVTVDCAGVQPLLPSLLTGAATTGPTIWGTLVPGYRVTFGGTVAAASSFNPWITPLPAPDAAHTVIAQPVHLEAGYYRLSWYARAVSGATPQAAVSLRAHATPNTDLPSHVLTQASGDWTQVGAVYYVATAGDYDVTLQPAQNLLTAHSVDLAALMLEHMDDEVTGGLDVSAIAAGSHFPARYIETIAAGVGLSPVCEDTDGAVFHTDKIWTDGEVRTCPAGTGTCANPAVQRYHELAFDVTLPGLESGAILTHSGFASGNYNYRLENLAVNFVGTAIRDCSDSPLPATCQSSGNILYTVEHDAGHVRNHFGGEYPEEGGSVLFKGRIEHARGLAAERYLTNPISSADRSLIEPYSHNELRGRPLTGHYVLRVWDDPAVQFSKIEDVQLVVDYRYWTRFE